MKFFEGFMSGAAVVFGLMIIFCPTTPKAIPLDKVAVQKMITSGEIEISAVTNKVTVFHMEATSTSVVNRVEYKIKE